MAERLIIQNFAGLNITVEVGEITVFIGPQASGKSICARCLYWFKSFIRDLTNSMFAAEDKQVFDTDRVKSFKEYFPNLWQQGTPFSIRFEIGEIHSELTQVKGKLKFSYSSAVQNAAAKTRAEIRRIQEKYAPDVNGRPNRILLEQRTELNQAHGEWQAKIRGLVAQNFNDDQAFVLAGRSIFSALQGNLLTFLSTNSVTDPLLRDFLREYEYVRQDQPQPADPALKQITPLVESILKGRLDTQHNEDIVVLADGRPVPLAYASSGQQEAFPLILFLLSYLGDYHRTNTSSQVLYVEEPEAHLYPDSQWAMVRLMAGIFNTGMASSSSQLVITTHSPYLLSAFNNLIRAHQLAEQCQDNPRKLKALYRIVPKNQQLALENFRVYALADGKARSIISAEDGLIVADKLDEVSERISQQFDKLLHLEAQAAADEKAS